MFGAQSQVKPLPPPPRTLQVQPRRKLSGSSSWCPFADKDLPEKQALAVLATFLGQSHASNQANPLQTRNKRIKPPQHYDGSAQNEQELRGFRDRAQWERWQCLLAKRTRFAEATGFPLAAGAG